MEASAKCYCMCKWNVTLFQIKHKHLPNIFGEFYKQVSNTGMNCIINNPTIHVQDFERHILWYNSGICVDTKPVYYKCLMERSILMVADITKEFSKRTPCLEI